MRAPGTPEPGPTAEALLTYREAGRRLGVTDRTVWTLVDRGELPAVRFGHCVRIDPGDLRAFIERSKGKAGGGGASGGGR